VPTTLGRLLTIKRHRPLVAPPATAQVVVCADHQWSALNVCETTPHAAPGRAHPPRPSTAPIHRAGPACDQPHSALGLGVDLTVLLADAAGGGLCP
jgi:hypothetical protein